MTAAIAGLLGVLIALTGVGVGLLFRLVKSVERMERDLSLLRETPTGDPRPVATEEETPEP